MESVTGMTASFPNTEAELSVYKFHLADFLLFSVFQDTIGKVVPGQLHSSKTCHHCQAHSLSRLKAKLAVTASPFTFMKVLLLQICRISLHVVPVSWKPHFQSIGIDISHRRSCMSLLNT